MIKYIYIFTYIFLLSFVANAQMNWNSVAVASSIKFEIGGPLGTTVDGRFNPPQGTFKFDPMNLANSNFNIAIDASSLNTDNNKRDTHLKKEEFFDVVNYNMITFKSSKIEKASSGYIATGTLKLKKVSKIIKIPFTFEQEGNKGKFTGDFSLNRLDYGVGTSSVLIKDMAKIFIVFTGSK